jgi:hypothetical protein
LDIGHSADINPGFWKAARVNWIAAHAEIAAVMSGVTAGLLTVIQQRKIGIILLAVQYLCVTWLVTLTLEFRLALIKLIAGWIVCGIFAVSYIQKARQDGRNEGEIPSGLSFRMIAVLLVSTAALGLGRSPVFDLSGISGIGISSSILLCGLGLLRLGLSRRPIGAGFGLLTLISGFEIVYSALEPSLAVMALIAMVNIGIGLALSIIEIDVEDASEAGRST